MILSKQEGVAFAFLTPPSSAFILPSPSVIEPEEGRLSRGQKEWGQYAWTEKLSTNTVEYQKARHRMVYIDYGRNICKKKHWNYKPEGNY